MKRFLLFTLFICLAAATFHSCEKESRSEVPVIILDNTHYEISPLGGSYALQYSISNPIPHEQIKATSEAAWITVTHTEKNIISFEISENPEKEIREALITVSYKSAEDVHISVRQEAPNDNLTIHIGSIAFQMIKVEGGSFTMGAQPKDTLAGEDEKPAHQVTLTDYYIGEFEVTQELWNEIIPTSTLDISRKHLPIRSVSWFEIQKFLDKLNKVTGKQFFLPSEAQWEYAARGGKKSQGYTFSGSSNLDEIAWFVENSENRIRPVGLKKPNELGLYDMNGNVWELCNDWWKGYLPENQNDPQGPEDGIMKVIRGGSFSSGKPACRLSYREIAYPSDRYDFVGFRLACR